MIYQYSDILDQEKELLKNTPERFYMPVMGPNNANGDAPTLPSSHVSGWTITMISKNCKDPAKAMKFISWLMSEEGQKYTYLGVEGVTYDMVDGKPVLKDAVRQLLDTDRTKYNRLYGADYTYWMLQDSVTPLKYKQETDERLEKLKSWSCPYTMYNGQYDSIFVSGSEVDKNNDRITKLWGETLPKLLLTESEESFDEILAQFCEEREQMGFDEMMEMSTQYMINAKKKLGIQE